MFVNAMSRKTTALALVCASLVSALLAANSARASACDSGIDRVETFRVRIAASDTVYQVGDTVRVKATVIRSKEGLDAGPAEGVWVLLVLRHHRRVVVTGAVTDATGKAIMKARLGSHLRPGGLDAHAIAQKRVADIPCGRPTEWGERYVPDFIRLAP